MLGRPMYLCTILVHLHVCNCMPGYLCDQLHTLVCSLVCLSTHMWEYVTCAFIQECVCTLLICVYPYYCMHIWLHPCMKVYVYVFKHVQVCHFPPRCNILCVLEQMESATMLLRYCQLHNHPGQILICAHSQNRLEKHDQLSFSWQTGLFRGNKKA